MVENIEDWSFLNARITETVSTTWKDSNRKKETGNVAPMGLLKETQEEEMDDQEEDKNRVCARLWEGSQTFENVREVRHLTVNFTRNPVIYAKGALRNIGSGYVNQEGKLIEGERSGWVECSAEFLGSERNGKVEKWALKVEDGKIEEKDIFTVSRGFNSVIEATVHATRVDFKPELETLIKHHLNVARKCGGEREKKACRIIEEETGISPEKFS